MNRAVWYLLIDERGQPAFDDVVWEENQRIIEGVAAQLKVYSNKDNIANPAMALKASALVGDGGGSEDMPLFVVVPKKTSPSGSLQSIASDSMDVDVRWKDEAPIVYSLEKGSMFFVNRTDAVKQLHEIHRSKFERAALEPMFITPPSTLSINYEAADDFLVDLTKVTGPVFIVLDEIRKAFQSDSLDDFQQRDCHGSYLNYVAQRPLDIHIKPNQYVFERLNIHNVSSSA
ncbi:hypothetical protein CcCBS67573_g10148 [Chytriomyces confervae]|uniref:Uncharacterized protein n=1 Tax=Chytriomyces confervae TaxID=246404 RepID=A0A507DDF8_9FUNG|nr:hypothetical protein CcCBS67573_g10148 [Chytriomyces confervae]